MPRRPGKPSERRIKDELRKLRKFIECPGQDPIAKRLAQVAEASIRWVTEETDWAGPMDDVDKFSTIINNEIVHSR